MRINRYLLIIIHVFVFIQKQFFLFLYFQIQSTKTINYEYSSNPRERRNRDYDTDDLLNSTQNLVHPDWEDKDPTPNIHDMFRQFDNKFFTGKLKCVSLEWSKRMYTCAGICYSRKNNYGMQCTIRLSEPLLKLRSRKNLVETLLVCFSVK